MVANLKSTALATALTLLTSGLAHAVPLEGWVSVMPAIPFQAAELKVSSPQLPIGFTGQAMTMMGQGHWLSAWGEYRHLFSDSSSLGLHGGLNQSWIAVGSYAPFAPVTRRVGPLRFLVGASYHHQWGNASLRLSPTLSLVYSGTINPLETLVIGPPLLEVAYRFTSGFEMGIRTSVTPLRASWVF
ncbi:hypothetical protein D3C72_177500 [compost metagenome]